MKTEIKVPSPGESITKVQLAAWLVQDGDYVDMNQEVAEIDSDKATLSISAPQAGRISLLVAEGDTVDVGAIMAIIDGDATAPPIILSPSSEMRKNDSSKPSQKLPEPEESLVIEKADISTPIDSGIHFTPLARKLMKEKRITEAEFVDYIRGIRVTREDIAAYPVKSDTRNVPESSWGLNRNTARRKMSALRMKLSERLVSVKNETAMLTTFNEVDMTAIMNIRKRFKDKFQQQHGVGLGFMSFFTKAVTLALREFPQLNAMLEEDELVMHEYVDIGIAVSSPKGLMVPVLRNAESMGFAQIELAIKELSEKARNNKISLDEMKGGTFTITNGGVFGSLLSTPILNPPQSAILGMHTIQERPVAVQGKVEIHPMMYVALSYDHRIIDGRESVGFLVKVKSLLEDPIHMLFPGRTPLEELLSL